MRKALFMGALLASAMPMAAPAATFLTAKPAQLIGGANVQVTPVYTVGDTLPNGYQSVGIFDGIGAFRLDDSTVRVLVNHELGRTAGKTYSLSNGLALTGARVSYFDIDRGSLGIVGGGQAYSAIYDRKGNAVTNASQIGGGFDRFCSSAAFEANTYGAGNGLADRIYFTGEETSGGTMYALNTATNELHAVPQFGRMAFENATQINTGTTGKVAFILSDDTTGSGADAGSPMYMYVGAKNAKGDGSFLDRNGLAQGDYYVWVSNDGKTNPSNFNANGSTDTGHWEKIVNYDPSKAGQPGYDADGYATAAGLRTQASAVGAFRFSRPEDVATNPTDTSMIALASTGSAQFGGADTWGTVYTLDTDFDANGNPTTATVKIAYDGNKDPSHALRSPDNLTWKDDGTLLIQEDRAADWVSVLGANPNDAGILEVGLDGSVKTFARIDRSSTGGLTDFLAGQLGEWESSGVLDVSALFGRAPGTLFLADVQAHGLRDNGNGVLLPTGLVEGGQLAFLTAVPEPATWAMMIAGFGFVGAAARRRRTALRFA